MIRKFRHSGHADSRQPKVEGGTKIPFQSSWKLEEVRLLLPGQAAVSSDAGPGLGEGTLGIVHQPFMSKDLLDVEVDGGSTPAPPATADKEYDLALLDLVTDAQVKQDLLAGILMQRHGLSPEQQKRETAANAFQAQRTALMEQAVKGAEEVNSHLVTWRRLAQFVVPPLLAGTVIATFVLMFRLLPLVSDEITGAELALLIFVLALVAVSPVTLLLIGRPLKGLDEWSPGKAAEPAAGDGTATGDTPAAGDGKPSA